MTYTVGQMAKMLGLAGSTLRYYDKEGLLPFVERSSGGIRMFREKDYEWLQIIECLKKAGMSIKDIKKYIVLLQQGDSTTIANSTNNNLFGSYTLYNNKVESKLI